MLPKISSVSRVSHLALGVALLNHFHGTQRKTNEYHPSKDPFATDCTVLLQHFPDSAYVQHVLNSASEGLYNTDLEPLSQNQVAMYLLDKLNQHKEVL